MRVGPVPRSQKSQLLGRNADPHLEDLSELLSDHPRRGAILHLRDAEDPWLIPGTLEGLRAGVQGGLRRLVPLVDRREDRRSREDRLLPTDGEAPLLATHRSKVALPGHMAGELRRPVQHVQHHRLLPTEGEAPLLATRRRMALPGSMGGQGRREDLRRREDRQLRTEGERHRRRDTEVPRRDTEAPLLSRRSRPRALGQQPRGRRPAPGMRQRLPGPLQQACRLLRPLTRWISGRRPRTRWISGRRRPGHSNTRRSKLGHLPVECRSPERAGRPRMRARRDLLRGCKGLLRSGGPAR